MPKISSYPRPRRKIILLICLTGLLSSSPIRADDLIYKVLPNDTISGIAQNHGVKTTELIAYNHLKHPDELSVGQELRIPPKPGVGAKYQVQDGDTLDDIARAHGVTVQDLIRFNELKEPDKLAVGQVLLIPGRPALPPEHVSLDPALKKILDGIPVKRGKWKYIVVHHSATLQGNAKIMDEYHRRERHMENGLAYHFVIGNGHGSGDGAIEIGNRWRRQIKGGHLASDALNEISVGICLVGNFDKFPPSSQQMKSLNQLLEYLLNRCDLGVAAVKIHRQINTKPTMCPGRLFPTQEMMDRLGA